MHNFQPNGKVSGVCVPVSALRTQQSLGWGMFTDLIPLGQWMRKCGLHVIQILPVK